MLVLSRKSGESLWINDNIEVRIVEVSNDKVKIGITAPKDVKILRSELCMTMESNKESTEKVDASKIADMFSNLNGN
ncbi:MAG: carbon storage regulator CsrA [Oscillospiraceae bacterium]